jgi:hypothetical protein
VEVAYVMDPDPSTDRLWRLSRPLDRDKDKPWDPEDFYDPKFLEENGAVISAGILYFGLRFWTPDTETWDEPDNVRQVGVARGPEPPEVRWDSTRVYDPDFSMHVGVRRTGQKIEEVLPSAVKIILIVAPDRRRRSGCWLVQEMGAEDTQASLSNPAGFPEAPGLMKVGSEWMRYSAVKSGAFEMDRRGFLDTTAAKHAAKAPVRWGERFATAVYLPCYRED